MYCIQQHFLNVQTGWKMENNCPPVCDRPNLDSKSTLHVRRMRVKIGDDVPYASNASRNQFDKMSTQSWLVMGVECQEEWNRKSIFYFTDDKVESKWSFSFKILIRPHSYPFTAKVDSISTRFSDRVDMTSTNHRDERIIHFRQSEPLPTEDCPVEANQSGVGDPVDFIRVTTTT